MDEPLELTAIPYFAWGNRGPGGDADLAADLTPQRAEAVARAAPSSLDLVGSTGTVFHTFAFASSTAASTMTPARVATPVSPAT